MAIDDQTSSGAVDGHCASSIMRATQCPVVERWSAMMLAAPSSTQCPFLELWRAWVLAKLISTAESQVPDAVPISGAVEGGGAHSSSCNSSDEHRYIHRFTDAVPSSRAVEERRRVMRFLHTYKAPCK